MNEFTSELQTTFPEIKSIDNILIWMEHPHLFLLN